MGGRHRDTPAVKATGKERKNPAGLTQGCRADQLVKWVMSMDWLQAASVLKVLKFGL